jgi:hypothetical protein
MVVCFYPTQIHNSNPKFWCTRSWSMLPGIPEPSTVNNKLKRREGSGSWLARFNQRISPLNQSLRDVSIYYLLSKALESRVGPCWTVIIFGACLSAFSLSAFSPLCSTSIWSWLVHLICCHSFAFMGQGIKGGGKSLYNHIDDTVYIILYSCKQKKKSIQYT